MAIKPIQIPKKSAGQQFQADAFFIVGTALAAHFIWSFIKAIFSPFRYVFEGRASRQNRLVREAPAKVDARKQRRIDYNGDPENLMYQYQQRFIDRSDEYRGDSLNGKILDWYGSWKRGEVLDSGMRWAPRVYKDKKMSWDFTGYLEIQIDLHLRSGSGDRVKFLETIRKYYPEFTPTFKGLEKDLKILKETMKEENASKELVEEIMKLNIPEDLAKELSQMEDDPSIILSVALQLKGHLENNFGKKSSMVMAKSKMDFCSNFEEAKKIDNWIEKVGIHPDLLMAFYRDEIDQEALKKYGEDLVGLYKWVGSDMYIIDDELGITIGDRTAQEFIKLAIRDTKNRMMEKETGDAKWKQH